MTGRCLINYSRASTLGRKYLYRYRLEADHSPPDDPSALLRTGLAEKQPVLRPDRGLWSPQSEVTDDLFMSRCTSKFLLADEVAGGENVNLDFRG